MAAAAREHFPMLKLIGRVALQVPFTNERGLISGLAQLSGIDPLFAVPVGAVAQDAIRGAVFTSQNGSSARAADRVADKRAGEDTALMRDPVEIRRLVDGAFVSSDGPQRVIVAEQKKNVRLGRFAFSRVQCRKCREHQCSDERGEGFHYFASFASASFFISRLAFRFVALSSFAGSLESGASPASVAVPPDLSSCG